ncbi:MAG: HD domain-containing phosphohydrolase [Sedimentibacter sp.]|uniref:HD domain-containing phosphohydrolase n=1 Tax=Sedimentibacter sp. TaxID=1960295 RepID=UPI0031590A3E
MDKTENGFYRYLAKPINELIERISVLGLSNKDSRSSLNVKKELSPVFEEIESGFGKLNNLVELIENMNRNVSFEGILKYIYTNFSAYIPYTHIGIALLKDEGRTLEASYGISDPSLSELPKKLAGLRTEISSTSLGNIVDKGIPRVINDLEGYTKNKNASYNRILIEAGIKSSITLPLKINERPIGIIFFSSTKKNAYKDEHIMFLETLSSSIAISLNKNIFIDEMQYSTLLALTKMAEARDEDTGDHLDRMTAYAVRISEFLLEDNLFQDVITVSFLKNIQRFSPLHDIGKVGIKDGILLKPGKLTDEEYNEMKKHVKYGSEVLRAAESNMEKLSYSVFKMGIEIVECHHEKWDGTGYPHCKNGREIPLSARIVAVADVFDALTSKRPYKKALTFEDSFSYILHERGMHFDPEIVDCLERHRSEFYKVYSSFERNKPA